MLWHMLFRRSTPSTITIPGPGPSESSAAVRTPPRSCRNFSKVPPLGSFFFSNLHVARRFLVLACFHTRFDSSNLLDLHSYLRPCVTPQFLNRSGKSTHFGIGKMGMKIDKHDGAKYNQFESCCLFVEDVDFWF